MNIFIDAGHGGKDSGAVGNGLKEKDLTLTISKLIKQGLVSDYIGHKTKLSRDKDVYLTLEKRIEESKAFKANYYMAVHINAGGGEGFESFIYNGKILSQTETLADKIHKEIIKNINVKDRGRKKENFYILRNSNCSAMLTENLFIDNVLDAKKLKDLNFINKIADAHVKAIAKALGLENKIKGSIPKEENKKLYRVVTGSFNQKTNAQSQVEYLKRKGIDSFIM